MYLYEVTYEAPAGGFGACHAIDVPLVFGVHAELGRVFGAEPPASAVTLGNLMRAQWAAFAADGGGGWPQYTPGSRLTRIFDDPPDVTRYPEGVPAPVGPAPLRRDRPEPVSKWVSGKSAPKTRRQRCRAGRMC